MAISTLLCHELHEAEQQGEPAAKIHVTSKAIQGSPVVLLDRVSARPERQLYVHPLDFALALAEVYGPITLEQYARTESFAGLPVVAG